MRRLLASAVSVVAIAVLAPALAGADGGGVSTTVDGHAGPHLSLAQLGAPDLPDMIATTRAPDGHETTDDHGGTTAQRLVLLAGIDPAHATSMAIDRPNTSGAVTLTHAEIVGGFDGDPLGGGARHATFRDYDGAAMQFFRPMRDDLDVNQPDELDAPTGADLVVHLTTDGPALTITAGATPNPAPNGTPVHFAATAVPGATYTWNFGDGQTSTGPAVVDHTYAGENQSYAATVTALTHDGGSGASVVDVQVGSAGGGGGDLTPAPVAPALSAGGGGASGGGGTAKRVRGGRGGPAAPATGPAHGARTHAHAPAPARPASAPPPGATAPRTFARPAPRATAHRAPSPPAPPASAGDRVSGVVLAGEGTAADLMSTDATPPSRDPAARASASAAQPLSWWLLAGLGLALLVGLGAARESGVRLTARLRPS